MTDVFDGQWILNISLQDHNISQPAFIDADFPYIQVHPMEFKYLVKNLPKNTTDNTTDSSFKLHYE